MSEGLKLPDQQKREKPKSGIISPDIPGKITEMIGSGHHAQASIVWQTIKWCFLAAFGLTLLAMFWAWLNEKESFKLKDIESIWGIFIPIITLALGYIFGKSRT